MRRRLSQILDERASGTFQRSVVPIAFESETLMAAVAGKHRDTEDRQVAHARVSHPRETLSLLACYEGMICRKEDARSFDSGHTKGDFIFGFLKDRNGKRLGYAQEVSWVSFYGERGSYVSADATEIHQEGSTERVCGQYDSYRS